MTGQADGDRTDHAVSGMRELPITITTLWPGRTSRTPAATAINSCATTP
jgi:hypothetical protein